MNRKLCILMCFLLIIISAGCSNNGESEIDPPKFRNNTDSCISGEILLFKPLNPGIEDYVSIMRLNMPENDDKYDYIKAVVIPKDELPVKYQHDGVVIDFNIIEIKSPFPLTQTGLFTPTVFLCSIELCQ